MAVRRVLRIRSTPVSLPQTLYKYCDLRGIDILQNRRLKVTPFNEFNDPFELAPRMRLQQPTEVAKTSILKDQEILQLTYRQMNASGQFPGSYDDFLLFIGQHNDRITHDLAEWFPGQAAEFRRGHVNEISREFGLICFSARRDATLMWSHYTRGHTGLVIGFNTSESLFSTGPALHEVEYDEDRAILDYPPKRHDPQLKAQINALIRRKSPEWEYEVEWRQQYQLAYCIRLPDQDTPTKSNYYFPISESSISHVILGCRCKDKRVHRTLQEKQFKHVQLLRAVQDDKLFQLHIVEEPPSA
jgi:hypothetical protein